MNLHEKLKIFPFYEILYKKFKLLNTVRKNHFDLERLLNPASPYHEDFIPAYQIITSSEEDLQKVLLTNNHLPE